MPEMHHRRLVRALGATFALALALAGGGPVPPARAADTAAGGTGDWPTYGGNLAAHRASALDGITPATVTALVPAWHKRLGKPVSMEGTPIVRDGVMYVTTGFAHVFAFDAASGAKKWDYAYPSAMRARGCCNVNNRGVTLVGDLVVTPTFDAHLVALDAATGKVRWNTEVAPYAQSYTITSPPLLADGVLITGVGGGEYGNRGFIAGYDPRTGKQLWRTYTAPAPSSPLAKTWHLRAGTTPRGAPTWLPGTYDPELRTVYWGVGNPNPDFDPTAFAGDALYSDCTLALDPRSGRVKWYHKYTSSDYFDYDAVSEPVLADLPMPDGTTVKAIAHADRDGYLFVLDRTNGKLVYAVPFVDRVNWAKIDRDGTVHPNRAIYAAARAMRPFYYTPGTEGGHNWQPVAYDAGKHVLVIPVFESSNVMNPKASPAKPTLAGFNIGGIFSFKKGELLHGSIVAFDLTTGQRLWKTHFQSPPAGGLLLTGGLVFAGEPEGKLVALDEGSGKIVWSSPTLSSSVSAPPVTYAVNGTQYVAVEAGKSGLLPIFYPTVTPWLKSVKDASDIYVWKLPAAR